jgi:hypothetical protein
MLRKGPDNASTKASFGGRCGHCFQPYEKGSPVRPHATAYRMLTHEECSGKDFGECVWCGGSLDDMSIVAVNYHKKQHSCSRCAVKNNWKSASALRPLNRLVGYFKKFD